MAATTLLLILDDSKPLRDTLHDRCEDAGYRFFRAEVGPATLNWLVSGVAQPAVGRHLARRRLPQAV